MKQSIPSSRRQSLWGGVRPMPAGVSIGEDSASPLQEKPAGWFHFRRQCRADSYEDKAKDTEEQGHRGDSQADAVAGVREFAHLNRAVEAAKLEVPIAAAYPLAEAAKAQE